MMTNWRYSFFNTFGLILLLGVSAFGIIYLQKQTIIESGEKATAAQVLQEQKEQEIFLDFIQYFPGLGYDNLISDWTFLNFVQYFGDNKARNKLGYTLSPQFFQTVVERDPRFVAAYLYLDPATTLFAGQPAESVKVMDNGIKFLVPEITDSYLVWMYKAVDELLFLGETQRAKKDYLTASQWAFRQNDERSRNIGRRAKETSQFLENNPDSKKAQASSWLMILANAKDQKTTQLTLDKIKSLGAEVKFEGNRVIIKFPEKD